MQVKILSLPSPPVLAKQYTVFMKINNKTCQSARFFNLHCLQIKTPFVWFTCEDSVSQLMNKK